MPRARSLLLAALLLAHEPAARAANQHVQFTTTLGAFVVELCGEVSEHCSGAAPLTVAHFLKLVDEDYYPASTLIDRHVPGDHEVIQGGLFYSGNDGQTDFVEYLPSTPVVAFENTPGLSNLRGSIALIYEQSLGGSVGWWYLNLTNNPSFDGLAAIFGEVVSGTDVLEAIADVPVYNYLLGNLPLIDYPGEPTSVVPYLVHVTSTERVPEPGAFALGGAAAAALAALARRAYPAAP